VFLRDFGMPAGGAIVVVMTFRAFESEDDSCIWEKAFVVFCEVFQAAEWA